MYLMIFYGNVIGNDNGNDIRNNNRYDIRSDNGKIWEVIMEMIMER